ncbi:MAG TPA: branched-chain amino acid transaminase [Candidatus Methylomirabilis sp.]|nr:branched-chain amino acid transaminase [Candidatus Methylomirabilis sp.]
MSDTPKWAWLDGEFVPWEAAKLHVRTECVMRGANVFEGVRGYWDERAAELRVLQLDEHLERLHRSKKVLRLQVPYSRWDFREISLELLRRNEFREDVHLRPTVYFGEGDGFGYTAETIHMGAFVTATAQRARRNVTGIACAVSSWQRISDRDVPPRVKAAGNYINARLATVQARVDGYDNAILLNAEGKVTEAPAACLFLIRDGVAVTPAVTSGILDSITRGTLLRLFRDELHMAVEERDVDRTELYHADEVFLCGTHTEVLPVVSVDRYPVGSGTVGGITSALRDLFFDIVRGRVARYAAWLTPVYGRVPAAPGATC